MLVSSLHPKPDSQAHFKLSDVRQVPEESGCYVLTVFDGTILYVGQSKNIAKRMEDHLNDPSKQIKTNLGVIFWFYYLLVDPVSLSDVERGWGHEHLLAHGELPKLNKIHPPT